MTSAMSAKTCKKKLDDLYIISSDAFTTRASV